MKHPAIGKLYSLRLSSKLLVHISPVEIIKEGFYNGSVICYIFNPELTAEYLYSSGSIQDLLLPALITYPQYFSKRFVTYIESDDVLELPFFTQHVFVSLGSNTLWDANGNQLESVSEGAHYSLSGLKSLTGICKLIGEKLNIRLSCYNLRRFRPGFSQYDALPPVDHVNKRQMLIIVDIPDESLNNRDQELEAIVNALMGGLEHGKFGDTVGTGFGESTSEVYLLIRARKYPEAIRGIRSALKDAGVSNFDLSLND